MSKLDSKKIGLSGFRSLIELFELMKRRKMLVKTLRAGGFLTLLPCFSYTPKSATNLQEIILRTIPSTGEKIPAIGMGTWLTFDVDDHVGKRSQLEDVLRIFAARGGRFIDSSPMYGSSEKVVGELVRKEGIEKDIFWATKVWTSGAQQGIGQMNTSMDLLNPGMIHLMQVHNLLDYRTHLKTLAQWKEEGKFKYIGITHYTTGAYNDLMQVMKEYPLDFVQFNFSIQSREAEKILLPFAADNGVAVVINRPYEGGALFSRIQGQKLPDWASEIDCISWGQFFLKYIISHPAVTCAIPATSNPLHMTENIGAAYGKLPDNKIRQKMADYFINNFQG